MLSHSAMLADTKVHHYFLTETFDAWETWDMIHNARERLRWGVWAYSHAAVKMPNGLKMPHGSYISWCNRGKHLLPEEDVKYLEDVKSFFKCDIEGFKEIEYDDFVRILSAAMLFSGDPISMPNGKTIQLTSSELEEDEVLNKKKKK